MYKREDSFHKKAVLTRKQVIYILVQVFGILLLRHLVYSNGVLPIQLIETSDEGLPVLMGNESYELHLRTHSRQLRYSL